MSLQPGNAYKWIKEGIGHYNAKRYKECLDACERAIQLDPDCAEEYYGKGLALAQQKRYGEALIAYQKASHLAPESAKIHAAMAELFYNVSNYEKSGLSYKRAIQLDSWFEAVYVERLKMLLDKAFELCTSYMFDLYTYDLAISAFREVLLFDPDNAIALAEIGKIQGERGLALVQCGRYKEAAEAYLEALQLNPEDAKLHANIAGLLYFMGNYEESGLSYKRAIQLDGRFEAVYVERLKMLLDKASKLHTACICDFYMCDLAINAFREVLLFDPDNAIALAEIEEIQKEVGGLKSCLIRYTGKLIYTSKRANSASISLYSGQSDEIVRIFFIKSVKDSDTQTNREYSLKYFSRSADGWRISFTFPLLETDFRVEVLRNEKVIAYGYYWIKNGYLGRDRECNVDLTIAYKPAGRSSEGGSNNWDNNSRIYVPDRTGGRNRRVRRGS